MTLQQMDIFDAMNQALDAVNETAGEWSVRIVDRILAEVPEPFTTDDCRDLIPPGISPHLLSARLNSARMRGRLVKIGERRSVKPEIHGKTLNVWVRR